jgi:hypothetical protein
MSYAEQEAVVPKLVDKIAALEAENAKLREVARASQVLLASCCKDDRDLHGMLELEEALERLEALG